MCVGCAPFSYVTSHHLSLSHTHGGGTICVTGVFDSDTPSDYSPPWPIFMDRNGIQTTRASVDHVIVLWLADTSRFVSMVASHLLSEGLQVANRGRIDDAIPIVVGVANANRWPIYSREVTARGLIRAQVPRVACAERHDYLLTVASGSEVDAAHAPRPNLPVIHLSSLSNTLSNHSVSAVSTKELLGIFSKLAVPAIKSNQPLDAEVSVREIADLCLEVITALSS